MCSVQKKLLNGKIAGKLMRPEWLRNLYSTLQNNSTSWLATQWYTTANTYTARKICTYTRNVPTHIYKYTCLSNSIKIIVYTHFFLYLFFSSNNILLYFLYYIIIITVILHTIHIYMSIWDSRAREQVQCIRYAPLPHNVYTTYIYTWTNTRMRTCINKFP